MMQLSLPRQQSCPDCDIEVETDRKHGEKVCPECGTVVEEGTIDHGPEWTAYTARDRNEQSRVGRPATVTLHDKGLSTHIGWKDQDSYGQQLSSRKRRQLQRLRTWDERCRTSGNDRTLRQALGEINRMACALGLPQTARETAGVIYRRAGSENLIIGRSIEGMATGAVYAAARQEGIPRSLDEVAAISRVDQRRFARAYRLLAEELKLAMKPPDPTDYIPRFASELELPHNVQRMACEVLSAVIGTKYMSGKNPVGLAAAALYASAQLSDEQLTQRAVSDVSNITRMTIRSHYRELIDRYESSNHERAAADD